GRSIVVDTTRLGDLARVRPPGYAQIRASKGGRSLRARSTSHVSGRHRTCGRIERSGTCSGSARKRRSRSSFRAPLAFSSAILWSAETLAMARPCRGLLSAQAERVAVRVSEHADTRVWCDLTRGVTLRCTSREQGLAGGVEILDIGEGHRPPACTCWIEADLEAVDVVADVIRLVGVRCAEQRGIHGLGRVQVRHRDHQAADGGTHVDLLM